MSLLQGLSKRLWGMFKSDLRVSESASRQQLLSALLGRGHRRSEELHNGIDCQRGCLPGMRRHFHGCLKKMSLQRRVQRRMPMWRRLQLPGIHHGNVPVSNLLDRQSSEFYFCDDRGWQLPGHDFQKMMIVYYIFIKRIYFDDRVERKTDTIFRLIKSKVFARNRPESRQKHLDRSSTTRELLFWMVKFTFLVV